MNWYWIIAITILISTFVLLIVKYTYIKLSQIVHVKSEIDDIKIIKTLLNKINIDEKKYFNHLKNNIDIIHILDNLNYYNYEYYNDKIKIISGSEKNINILYEQLQNSSSKSKVKILFYKNEINKNNYIIEGNYIKIINRLFKDKDNHTVNLLEKIKIKIEKVKMVIEKTIINEEENGVEVWKSEIDRLNDYIYIEKVIKEKILNIREIKEESKEIN